MKPIAPALALVLALASLVPGRGRAETLTLKLADGSALRAEVQPARSRPGEKTPAWIILGGFEHESEVLNLIHPPKRVTLASFDYPYTGERRFHFPATLLEAPKLRTMVRHTLEAIPTLARALASDPAIGPVCLVGASFGAPFAAVAAARDRLPCLVLVHGFADVRGTLVSRLEQVFAARTHWPQFVISPLASAASWAIDEALAFPEPTRAPLLSAGTRVLVIEARDDHVIPKSSREALWNWVKSSPARADRIIMPGDHLEPGSDTLVAEIARRISRWIRP